MATSSINAGTTRTQAGATPLTDEINRVDVSTPTAGIGDGVILPVVFAGTNEIVVINNTPNVIQLYAFGNDTINGVAGSVGVGIAPGVMVFAMLASPGSWQAMGGPTPNTTINGSNGGNGGGQDSDITSIGITSVDGDLHVSNTPLTANGNIDLALNTVSVAKGGTGLTAVGTDGQVLTAQGGVAVWATPNVLAGAMTVLDKVGAAQSVTGTTTETALHTTPVNANSMSTNGGLIVISRWSYTNNADSKNLHVRLGGLTGTDFFGFSTTTSNTLEMMTVIQNRGATNQQIGSRPGVSFGTSTTAFSTGNRDTTVEQDLVLSGAPTSNADIITLESAIILAF